ncbi:MAG: dephospho-CoA kinase [Paludibacter sp.]
MKNTLIIGITGGIGSGKTTLSEHLRREGYSVYDSDKEARRLQNEHPVIREKLTELFGADIYNESGLNRAEIAKIVFGNPELLRKLNDIVHPVVRDDFKQWIMRNNSEKYAFVESAILFESGFNKLVDKVILMTASEELRIRRVIKRDGVNPEQVKARMSNQFDDKDKIPFADYVIHTDDNLPMIDKMKRLLLQLSDI